MEDRKVKGYEDLYKVSEDGVVTNIKKNKPLKPAILKDGTLRVTLSKNGIRKNKVIAHLVAEAFLEKPLTNERLCVLYKDNDKNNLHYTNLFYCTYSMAMNRGDRNKKIADSKGIKIYCAETDKVYKSMKEAAQEFGLTARTIKDICEWKRLSTRKGYHFAYLEDKEELLLYLKNLEYNKMYDMLLAQEKALEDNTKATNRFLEEYSRELETA